MRVSRTGSAFAAATGCSAAAATRRLRSARHRHVSARCVDGSGGFAGGALSWQRSSPALRGHAAQQRGGARRRHAARGWREARTQQRRVSCTGAGWRDSGVMPLVVS